MYKCTHMYTHIHTHIHTHMHTNTHIQVNTYTNAHAMTIKQLTVFMRSLLAITVNDRQGTAD